MKITLRSHGLKQGPLPTGASLYIDARSIPDPATVKGVNLHDGSMNKQFKLQNGVDIVDRFMPLIEDTVRSLPSRRVNSSKPVDQCEVICFCAYGLHRSVTLKKMLAAEIMLTHPSWVVEVK